MRDNNKQLKIFAISCDLDDQIYESLVAHYDKVIEKINRNWHVLYKSRIRCNSIIWKFLNANGYNNVHWVNFCDKRKKPPTNDVVL